MYSGILPCCTHPKPDELLSSWLVRLSHGHLSKVHTFCKLLFPGVNIWNRDIDKIATDLVLYTLAEKTLTPLFEIRKTTLRNYEGRLYLQHNPLGNTRWILPLGIYHRQHKNNGLVFCPLCLRNDGQSPYFRKKWRLAFSVVCVDCGVYLHDNCPRCVKPIVFFRSELGRKNELPSKSIALCYNCGFDLCESNLVYAKKDHYRCQKEIYRIMDEGWKRDVLYPHLYFDVLHQLLKVLKSHSSGSQKFRANMEKMFGIIDDSNRKTGQPFEFISLSSRIKILEQGFWLMEDFENHFLEVGRQSNITSTIFFNDMLEIPYWYHEMIMRNFFVSNVNRRF